MALRLAAPAVLLALATPAMAQGPRPASPAASTNQVAPPPDVSIVISKEGGRRNPIAVPVPIAPITPDLQGRVVDPFYTALTEDLGSSVAFLVTDPAFYPKAMRPPATREQADAWIASSAQYLLDTRIETVDDQMKVVAQLWDLRQIKSVFGRQYTGEARAARRMAHTLANDLLKQFTGKPGPFLTRIAFVSDRDGGREKEIWSMDFDGENQRRLTSLRSLSLAPDWFADGSRIAFQSYVKKFPALFTINKDGGDRREVVVPTELNASPSVSPDGKTIAFCGSVKGNPEIFTVGVDGSNLKRLTESTAVDSTPRWSPNGRELAFTSNRQGSPQIYMMDLEGANVRRVTFAGNWNDEASFSPDGSKMAFACRNEGDFQICVLDRLNNRTVQISTGPGAHENPTWSPDGSKMAWEVTRGGSTQVVVANAFDGSGARVVTSAGSNTSPAWSKTLE